jgi:DNA polymerase kappa
VMKGSNDENEKLNCKKEENVSNNLLASGNSGKSGLPSSLNEINLRIREASKDSRFTAAQERKAVELEAKVSHQRDQLKAALSQPQMVRKARRMVDAVLGEFEGEQMLQFLGSEEFCWVCVDMDAFFAAVECLDAPELRNVPMAVGSSAMLSTSNYAARKFGVSAAMPGYIAKQLCPELRIVPLRYERYRELSGQVSCVLHEYDPELSMWSLDEAVLLLKRERVCGQGESFGSVVERMRKQVYETTGLTCSAGIACNPLLAKLASNYRKPDGQFEIERTDPEQMRNFLHEQPVHKLTGIGKVMALTLEKLWNVKSIGDLVSINIRERDKVFIVHVVCS